LKRIDFWKKINPGLLGKFCPFLTAFQGVRIAKFCQKWAKFGRIRQPRTNPELMSEGQILAKFRNP